MSYQLLTINGYAKTLELANQMSGQRELFHISQKERHEIVICNHRYNTFRVKRTFDDKIIIKLGLNKYIASCVQDAVNFVQTASMFAGGLAGDPILQLQNAIKDLRCPKVSIW